MFLMQLLRRLLQVCSLFSSLLFAVAMYAVAHRPEFADILWQHHVFAWLALGYIMLEWLRMTSTHIFGTWEFVFDIASSLVPVFYGGYALLLGGFSYTFETVTGQILLFWLAAAVVDIVGSLPQMVVMLQAAYRREEQRVQSR